MEFIDVSGVKLYQGSTTIRIPNDYLFLLQF